MLKQQYNECAQQGGSGSKKKKKKPNRLLLWDFLANLSPLHTSCSKITKKLLPIINNPPSNLYWMFTLCMHSTLYYKCIVSLSWGS